MKLLRHPTRGFEDEGTIMSMTSSRYIPHGSNKITDKLSDAIAYLYEENGKYYGIGYHGKANRPDWHINFGKRLGNREQYVKEYFEGRQRHVKFMQEHRDDRKSYVNDYTVGDILNTCWGYEQTNVEYFEVVASSGAMVTIRQIGKEYVESGSDRGNSVPLPGLFVGEAFKKRAQKHGIRIDECRIAMRSQFEMVGSVKIYASHYESSYA
jgi:hypothetical protein